MKLLTTRNTRDAVYLLYRIEKDEEPPEKVWFWYKGPVWQEWSVIADFNKRSVTDFTPG